MQRIASLAIANDLAPSSLELLLKTNTNNTRLVKECDLLDRRRRRHEPAKVAQLQGDRALRNATGRGELLLRTARILHNEIGQHLAQFRVVGMDVNLGEQVVERLFRLVLCK